ncbi:MAG TPA: SRPBCC family protein [Acidimicrobiia bacterium]|nr:SRPBCC family protein [Acidimicrobiia bacterium]
MELSNEFVVPVAVEEAWRLLTDVERIAPCMPGAELQEIEGEEYRGVVKVKVGPITAQYKGKATFVEKDDAAHKAVLRAEGRDTRGQGNANATITATLVSEGTGTKVKVVTDLAITGRAAQFGRGVMADVSTKLLGQFVSCLEKNVLGAPAEAPADAAAESPAQPAPAEVGASREGAAAAPSVAGAAGPQTREPGGASDAALAGGASGTNGKSSAVSTGPRTVTSKPAEPVDLLGAAGSPVVKRLVPAFVGALLAFLIGRRIRRGRRG